MLQQVLEEISNFRQEKGIVFLPNVTTLSNFSTEMLSWTAASGPDGLKDSLMLQVFKKTVFVFFFLFSS